MQVARPTTLCPEALCRHAQAKPIFVLTANQSCVYQPPPNLRGYLHLNLMGIFTPHRLETSHPCEVHGMAVESYSVLDLCLAPQAKNLLPDATPHTRYHDYDLSVPRMLSSVTSMLELLACVRHWSCWGSIASRVIDTCDLLHASVGELQETSHSICRSVGGNIASVPHLPGQPDDLSGTVHQTASAILYV